jgi:hypothetical protein
MATGKHARGNTGDQLTDSARLLAQALAAVDAMPVGRTAIRWTPEADAVIKAAHARGVPTSRLPPILAPLLGGRVVSRMAVDDRMRVLTTAA